MTPEELRIAIFNEFDGSETASWHFMSKDTVDLFLLEPKIIELVDRVGIKRKFWLVLDEKPQDSIEGYRVVFSEIDDMFGLVTKRTINDISIGYLIGLHGSFVDTLESM